MFAKSRARQGKSWRLIESLLIAVAGCALTTGSALAQACDGASGGTVTVSSSNLCSTITLSNGTNLQVTNTGSMTNIFSGTGAGNITIDGTVARAGRNAIGGSGSIGSLTLGPGSTVSATGAVYAIDYRLVSTLASFTNNGAVSSSTSGFVTRNSTVNGDVVNNGTFSTFSRAIEMVSSTINGDVTNSAMGTITTTSTGNISGSGIILNGSRVTGNVTNAGRMYGQDGGTTYGFLISNTTNVDGSFINSGTISGTTSLYNHGAFIQNATFGGTVTNTTTGIINTAGRGLFLNSVTASALQNLGSITTGGEGIRVEGSTLGSLLNSGTITTTGAGSTGILSSNVTYNGAVTNSGSISSLATGMSLSGGTVNGNVTNTATGTIETTAATGTNLGIFSSAAITGSLINDGVITGGGGTGTGRAGISTSGGSIGGNLANIPQPRLQPDAGRQAPHDPSWRSSSDPCRRRSATSLWRGTRSWARRRKHGPMARTRPRGGKKLKIASKGN